MFFCNLCKLTEIGEENNMFCANCAKKNPEGSAKCEQCGLPLKAVPPPVQRHHQRPSQATMQFKRKVKYHMSFTVSQKYGGSGEFDIVMDGMSQGKIKSGKTLAVVGEEEIITVVIKAWGLNPLKTKFRIEKDNAHAEIGMWKKNILFYGVTGAEIVKG
jgi:hypothetical protein